MSSSVEMQVRLAKGDITSLLSLPSGQWNSHLVGKACGCEQGARGNKFTMMNYMGLKKTASIDFVARVGLTGRKMPH
jgi:hypothetical protein